MTSLMEQEVCYTVEPQCLEHHAHLPWPIELVFESYDILPIAPENKYLGKFSYFIMEVYVVLTH